jgi:NAD(P)-dependent dehydrogenase (short-subunit alcohol dehydrogenase family)
MTENKKNLAGKVAVVTGGGRGIGSGIVERLAADGAFVVVNYHSDKASAEGMVAKIGGHGVAVQADVGTVAGIDELYRQTDEILTKKFGSNKIDILVCNACTLYGHGIDATEEDYDRHMGTNLKGPWFLASRIQSRMPDGGRIVNISSAAAKAAHPVVPLYSIAKFGITGLTRNLALILGPRNICVNGIEPGMTMTDAFMENMKAVKGYATGSTDEGDTDGKDVERQALPVELPEGGFEMDDELAEMIKMTTALGRMGGPSDIARVVSFLVSDDGRWVTGQSFGVDGGLKL